MNAYDDSGCGCGQGSNCPGRRCQCHRDNPTGNAQEKAALGLLPLPPADEAWMQAAVAERKAPSTKAYDALRELRQWHMSQVHQATANRERAASATLAERYRADWSLHMGAVQTLNEFFPLGDYAS